MINQYILYLRLDSAAFAALTVGSGLFAQYWFHRQGLPIGRHPWRKWACVAGLIVAASIVAELFGYRARLALQETATFFAADYACDLANMDHAKITPTTPPDDELYLDLIAAEQSWLRINSKIGDIYTYRRSGDGRFVSLVSAESGPVYAGDRPKARTPIGQPLPMADDAIARAAGGEALIDRVPVADERGVWIRALQPVLDSNGQVDAVLGLNFPAGPWLRSILLERLLTFIRFYVLFVLAVCIDYIARQQGKLKEQSETETRLRESENRFRSLCEDIPNIAVQGYDRERRVIFWNKASTRLYGFTRGEALGQPLETLIIPPAMREPVVAGVNQWINGGAPIPPGELVLLKKDGSPVNVYSSHVMQRGPADEPEMYCLDIELSERNQALAALAISEANYRTLFEVIPHPMCVYDLETHFFVAVNHAALEQYGYSREEFLRMRLQDIPCVEQVPLMREVVAIADATGSNPQTEWYHRKKNGEVILVEVSSHLLTWAGRRARILLALDITARREAERRIVEQARLLDKTSEAIVVVDSSNRIIFWNRGAERLFLYTAREMCGRTVQELLELGRVPGAPMLAEALGHVGGDWRGEIQGLDRNNRPMCIETSVTIIRDDEGRVTARFSVSADITKRKALEAQIIQAQKMEVLGQLAGGVAHDFNSILMAMTLNLEMLESDLRKQPAAMGMLGDLKTMTQRAAKLIGQLLLFARKQTMKTQTVELNDMLGAVMKMLQRLIGIDIALELRGDSLDLWIEADTGMIDQVVLNLCVNARDAMPKGGVLTISTSRVELTTETAAAQVGARAGSFACLQVTDTGHGMSPEVLAHNFEPFFTTKAPGKGTGLGLSTVHGIVHQHHGWITVQSKVGHGTTFSVFLPISANQPAAIPDAAEEAVKVGSETILLVEDDEAVRRICAAMLLRLGYRVWLSGDGPSALQLWERNPGAIDLLLSDIVLPGGMGGLELAEQLLQRQPSLRVVLMSGNNAEIMKADGLMEKGIRFVQKPVESATLASVIRECLD